MAFIVWGWLGEGEVMPRWMLIECFLKLACTNARRGARARKTISGLCRDDRQPLSDSTPLLTHTVRHTNIYWLEKSEVCGVQEEASGGGKSTCEHHGKAVQGQKYSICQLPLLKCVQTPQRLNWRQIHLLAVVLGQIRRRMKARVFETSQDSSVRWLRTKDCCKGRTLWLFRRCLYYQWSYSEMCCLICCCSYCKLQMETSCQLKVWREESRGSGESDQCQGGCFQLQTHMQTHTQTKCRPATERQSHCDLCLFLTHHCLRSGELELLKVLNEKILINLHILIWWFIIWAHATCKNKWRIMSVRWTEYQYGDRNISRVSPLHGMMTVNDDNLIGI